MLILFHRHWRFLLIVWFYLLLVLVVFIYWPGLSGPLLLDDAENLLVLSDYHRSATTWQQVVFENVSSRIGRPVSMLSFLFDVVTRGTLYFNFKYHNLMLHLLAGSLVFWLAGRLSSIHLPPPRAWTMALLATSLWMLSPLQVSTVLYVVQRMTLLSSILVVVGLLCYTLGRQRLEARPGSGWGLILSSYLVWTPLAVLAKENGALLPLLCSVTEFFMFRFSATPPIRKRLLVIHLLFCILPLLIAVVVLLLFPHLAFSSYAGRDFTLAERLLTQPRVLWDYVLRFFYPSTSGLGVYHDDFPLSTGWFSPITTLPALLALGMAGWLVWQWRKGSLVPIGFGVTFFLAGHLLESTALPLEIYFEHRNYLPTMGLALAAAFLVMKTIDSLSRRWAIFVILAVYFTGLSASTFNQANIWSARETILRTSEIYHPNSSRVSEGLARLVAARGNMDRARFYLSKMVAKDNRLRAGTAIFTIILYCKAKQPIPDSIYQEVAEAFDSRRENSTVAAIKELASLLRQEQCPHFNQLAYAQALERGISKVGISVSPNLRWFALTYAADEYVSMGEVEQGLKLLSQAEQIFPDRLDPGLIRLRLLLSRCELDAARELSKRLRAIEPKWRRDYLVALDHIDQDILAIEQTQPCIEGTTCCH